MVVELQTHGSLSDLRHLSAAGGWASALNDVGIALKDNIDEIHL